MPATLITRIGPAALTALLALPLTGCARTTITAIRDFRLSAPTRQVSQTMFPIPGRCDAAGSDILVVWLESEALDKKGDSVWWTRFDGQSVELAPSQKLTTVRGEVTPPDLAVSLTGKGLMTWTQKNGDDVFTGVWASLYSPDTKAWSKPERIEDHQAFSSTPVAAVDKAGNGTVAWVSRGDIWVNRFDATTNAWDKPLALATGGNASAVRAGVGADGDVLLTWLEGRQHSKELKFTHYRVATKGWSETETIERGVLGEPRMVVGPGTAFLLWVMDYKQIHVIAFDIATGQWTPGPEFAPPETRVARADIQIDAASGNVLVAWKELVRESAPEATLFVRWFNAATREWGPIENPEADPSLDGPFVRVHGQRALLLSQQADGRLWFSQKDHARPDSAWTKPVTITSRAWTYSDMAINDQLLLVQMGTFEGQARQVWVKAVELATPQSAAPSVP